MHLGCVFVILTFYRIGMGIVMPKFAPFHKDSCTIFQIGTAFSRLQYLHFDQSSCESDEDYLRSPIVYSALDVSKSFASDLIIQDAPGALFKVHLKTRVPCLHVLCQQSCLHVLCHNRASILLMVLTGDYLPKKLFNVEAHLYPFYLQICQ